MAPREGSAQRLVEAYATAARQIDQLPNRLDREVGLAALRIDAAVTREWLQSRGGAAAAEVSPLADWSAAFGDGTTAIKVVDWVDDKVAETALEVVKDVSVAAASGTVTWSSIGLFAFVAGVVAALVDWGHDATTALLLTLAGAAVPPVVVYGAVQVARRAPQVAQGLGNELIGTWNRAKELGAPAQAILDRTSRPLEAEIRAAFGAPAPAGPSSFIARARLRATAIVGAAFFVLGAGLLCLGVGGAKAVDEFNRCPTPSTAFPTTAPPFGGTPSTDGCD